MPEKNFKIVRYIGIYSRRGYRHTQTEFNEAVIVLIKRSWREEIKKTFEYDPLICPYCNTEMALIGICYEGTESYPIDDPQPVKPPPNIKFIQNPLENKYASLKTCIKPQLIERFKNPGYIIGYSRQ